VPHDTQYRSSLWALVWYPVKRISTLISKSRRHDFCPYE
jgi:hypothetical protein